jgi:hypothetical protein
VKSEVLYLAAHGFADETLTGVGAAVCAKLLDEW